MPTFRPGWYRITFCVRQHSTATDDLGYNDVGLCNTLAIALYVLWYQLITHKARVFFALLNTTYILVIASTSVITTLPVISTNIILQVADYSVNSNHLLVLEKAILQVATKFQV